ncbi:hypothetical protein VD0002_g6073 [Verticillium dahliae]|nr:hypothetical protein VD0002_g6073 [Verticillium dahliae]
MDSTPQQRLGKVQVVQLDNPGAVRKQIRHCFQVTNVGRCHEGCVPKLVSGVHVDTHLDQSLDDGHLSARGCQVESRSPCLGPRRNISPVTDEQVEQVEVASLRSQMHRKEVVIIRAFRAGTKLEKHANNLRGTVVHRQPECRQVCATSSGGIRSMAQQQSHDICVSVHARHVKRSDFLCGCVVDCGDGMVVKKKLYHVCWPVP